mmetsp:Transcript_26490/g.52026  ORF Transcript_26490/g.52026 Transcript_26490/m.52026 type:complete len:96 (-) Transcript_26490:76-363(-)
MYARVYVQMLLVKGLSQIRKARQVSRLSFSFKMNRRRERNRKTDRQARKQTAESRSLSTCLTACLDELMGNIARHHSEGGEHSVLLFRYADDESK